MENALHMRTTSGFALSIATGLAMESLFKPRQTVADPNRVGPGRIPLNNYKELWINVQTLIRNIYQASEKSIQVYVTPESMYEVLQMEMDLIKDLLKIEGGDIVKPVFFINNYESLFLNSSKIYQRREDRTGNQIQARHIYKKASMLAYRNNNDIETFQLKLKGQGKTALILTSNPADLLSYREFDRLDFLESHTGKLKTRQDWNSKYYSVPGSDMGRLPFCRQLLGVFGDSSMIVPGPIKVRKEIIELASKCYWNPSTLPSKVSNDLNRLSDPVMAGIIRGIPLY